MEIRFSSPVDNIAGAIQRNAIIHRCHARVRWTRPAEARFTLHNGQHSIAPATSDQHDSVIRALLTLDPDARVRTARAHYAGLDDFERQVKARTQEV